MRRQRPQDHVHGSGLQKIVVGAALDGLDGRSDAGVASQQDDTDLRLAAAQRINQLQARLRAEPQVDEREIQRL